MSEGQPGLSGQAGRAAPLSRWSLFAYSLPAAPIAALGLPLVVHLPTFYAQSMGLGLSLVGLIFMLARFWDVITDPILGVLSDKFETRWGRRRHWIVLSVPILMLSVYMLFMAEAPVSAAYLVFWLFCLYVGWTLLTISHLSWGAEVTADYHERSSVQGWRELLLLVGVVVVMALPVYLGYGDEQKSERVAAMGWYVILLLPVTVAFAVWSVGERKSPRPEHIGLRQAVTILVENKPLRYVLLVDLISGMSGGIVASLFLFLAEDALKLGKFSNILLLCYFLSGMIFIPLVLWISRKFGKHQTASASALLNAVTIPLILFIPVGSYFWAAAAWMVFGINMAAGPLLFRSLMADVADYDSVQSRQTRTGLFYALLASTNKIGGAVAIGLAYAALDMFGFDASHGAHNTEAAIDGLRMVYIWPATVISFFCALILWKFPLGEAEQKANRAILDRRVLDAAAAAVEMRTFAPSDPQSSGAPAD